MKPFLQTFIQYWTGHNLKHCINSLTVSVLFNIVLKFDNDVAYKSRTPFVPIAATNTFKINTECGGLKVFFLLMEPINKVVGMKRRWLSEQSWVRLLQAESLLARHANVCSLHLDCFIHFLLFCTFTLVFLRKKDIFMQTLRNSYYSPIYTHGISI